MPGDHRDADGAATRVLSRATLLVASCAVVGTVTWIILSRTPPTGWQFGLIQFCAALAGAAAVTAHARPSTISRQVLAAIGGSVFSCAVLVAARQLWLTGDADVVPKFGSGILPMLFVTTVGLGEAALVGGPVGLAWSVLIHFVKSAGRASIQRSAS